MRKKHFIILILLSGLSATILCQSVNHWEAVVYNDDTWNYLIGLNEPDQDWRSPDFDDSAWSQGKGGFGYGDSDDNTVIPSCLSVYLRIRFLVADTGSIASALLCMDYDDAFVAYLNDVEIARVGISGVHPSHDQTGNDHEASMYRGGNPESFQIDKDKLNICLKEGENVLSVQVHNSSVTSSDLTSNVFLFLGVSDTTFTYREVPQWFVEPGVFSSTNLPLVIIETNPGETIMDEPKIIADMKIINNGGSMLNNIKDEGNEYSGKIGIEIRGRYSATLPQKPYGIETRNSTGSNLNVSLFGFPPENDWILLANYNDKTFLRNFLAFEIFREMGHYAPRSRYCEVVIDDEYQGIYLLTEKIKIDQGRVNIFDMNSTDNIYNDITGGYIFKNDYYTESDSWLSSYSPVIRPGAEVYFVYHDPGADELTPWQKNYIRYYVDTFESVLYGEDYRDLHKGYSTYLDVSSFVDYFILGEVTRNIDAYKKSRFYYKDRNSINGLIFSGPPWDFDWAWKNISDNCDNFNKSDGSGWAYRINECEETWPVPPSWEIRLMQDRQFVNMVHNRYYALRNNILSQAHLDHIIDSVASLLDAAQARHFEKWEILGINVGTPEVDVQPTTYAGEIIKMKSWIATRLSWLDANMPGRSGNVTRHYKPECIVFPNPVGETTWFESDTIISKIEIFNYSGVPVAVSERCDNYYAKMNLAGLGTGLYFVSIHFRHGDVLTRKVIKK